VSNLPDSFPLDWRTADPNERRRWFETLWEVVLELRDRYQLPVRSRWWEEPRQVEVLAALAVWVDRYDSGDWDDPHGKLTLLFELERIEQLLRNGDAPLHPVRDRQLFDRCLDEAFGHNPPVPNP
jgi:pullulanase/glycogen debranching enzyme